MFSSPLQGAMNNSHREKFVLACILPRVKQTSSVGQLRKFEEWSQLFIRVIPLWSLFLYFFFCPQRVQWKVFIDKNLYSHASSLESSKLPLSASSVNLRNELVQEPYLSLSRTLFLHLDQSFPERNSYAFLAELYSVQYSVRSKFQRLVFFQDEEAASEAEIRVKWAHKTWAHGDIFSPKILLAWYAPSGLLRPTHPKFLSAFVCYCPLHLIG
uniref:Orf4 protein n=1 Tax=Kudoa septempunctata TaxID=751907 RepID=A0A0H5AY25_9CNID|nr:orf4 protein [Kudoa septempunctata]